MDVDRCESWSQSEEQTLAEAARVATYLWVLVLGFCLLGRRTVRPLLYGLACAVTLVSGLAVLSRLVLGRFPAEHGRRGSTRPRGCAIRSTTPTGSGSSPRSACRCCCSWRPRQGPSPAACWEPPGCRWWCCALGLPSRAAGSSRGRRRADLLHRADARPDSAAAPQRSRWRRSASLVLMVALLDRAGVRNVLVGQRASCAAPLDAGRVVRHVRRRRAGPGRDHARGAARDAAARWSCRGEGVEGDHGSRRGRHRRGRDRRDRRRAQSTTCGQSSSSRTRRPPGNSYFRLLSIAGSHRYQYWQAAVHAFEAHPWDGIGPGTFQFYWSAHNTLAEFVRNAHSLWIETLAELGIVGLALIGGLFALSNT